MAEIKVEFLTERNESLVGVITLNNLFPGINGNVSRKGDEDDPEIRDANGESLYIIVVILVYAVAIVFMIASNVFVKKKKEETGEYQLKIVSKFWKQQSILQEKGKRESFKKLKHSIVPAVAKSAARDLISRRKSFAPILANAGIYIDGNRNFKVIMPPVIEETQTDTDDEYTLLPSITVTNEKHRYLGHHRARKASIASSLSNNSRKSSLSCMGIGRRGSVMSGSAIGKRTNFIDENTVTSVAKKKKLHLHIRDRYSIDESGALLADVSLDRRNNSTDLNHQRRKSSHEFQPQQTAHMFNDDSSVNSNSPPKHRHVKFVEAPIVDTPLELHSPHLPTLCNVKSSLKVKQQEIIYPSPPLYSEYFGCDTVNNDNIAQKSNTHSIPYTFSRNNVNLNTSISSDIAEVYNTDIQLTGSNSGINCDSFAEETESKDCSFEDNKYDDYIEDNQPSEFASGVYPHKDISDSDNYIQYNDSGYPGITNHSGYNHDMDPSQQSFNPNLGQGQCNEMYIHSSSVEEENPYDWNIDQNTVMHVTL